MNRREINKIIDRALTEALNNRIKIIDEAGEKAKRKKLEEEASNIQLQMEQLIEQANLNMNGIVQGLKLENYLDYSSIMEQFQQNFESVKTQLDELASNKMEIEEYLSKRYGKNEDSEKEKRNDIKSND